MKTFPFTSGIWARSVALAAALALSGCGADSVESLIASGQALAAKNDHKGAVIQFKTALQKDPQSGEARYLLGKALLASGDPVAAALELSKALDQKVSASKVAPQLARAYLFTGEYAKVTSQFGELQLDDKAAQASLKTSVATAWAAQGKREPTVAAVAAALQAQPGFPPALVLEARIQAGQRNFDRAKALLEEVLKAEPSSHEAWHLKGELIAFLEPESPAADEAFRKALSLQPAFISSHLALISRKIRVRDLAGARTLTNELRKVLPKHPQTIYIDAQLAFGERDFKKARELAQVLLRGLPDNPGVLQLAGAVEGQLGALVLAESHFSKALQLNPQMHVARRNLSQVYLRLGQPQKSLDTLKPFLEAGVKDAETLAIAGEAHLRLGNARAAEAAFRQAAESAPNDLRIRTAVALTHLSRGEPETTFSELEALARESDSDTFADLAIISARLSRGETDEALMAANALVAKTKGKGSSLEARGRIQALRKDYAAARKDFEQALTQDPTLFSSTISLAGVDILENKPEQAQQRLDSSVKADPKNHYARSALAELRLRQNAPLDNIKALLEEGIALTPNEPSLRLQLIEMLLGKRLFKEALSVAQDASASMPGDLRIIDSLGRAQMEAGDVEQAITTFRKLAEASPRSAVPHLRLSDIYRATKRLPLAESSLRRALELDPNVPGGQATLASLLLSANRLPEALELGRQIQRQRPRSVEGYALEANVLLRQKQPDAALATYKRGLAVKDHDPELARQYYLTLYRTGRTAEADQFGANWIKANPNDLAFEYQLAVAAIQTKKYDEAESRFQRVVQAQPENMAALNNLAWVMASRGKQGATALAQRALNLAPDKPEFMDTFALALMVDKQVAKALEVQKRVVELRPAEPSYRLSLARIAIEAGDKSLARAELDRLKALGASYPQQAEVAALAQKL